MARSPGSIIMRKIRSILTAALISDRKLDLNSVQQEIADFLMGLDGIRSALTAHNLQNFDYSKGLNDLLQNGFLPRRSGRYPFDL